MTLVMKYREEREAGKAEMLVNNVNSIMETFQVSLEDAVKSLKLTMDEYYDAKESVGEDNQE